MTSTADASATFLTQESFDRLKAERDHLVGAGRTELLRHFAHRSAEDALEVYGVRAPDGVAGEIDIIEADTDADGYTDIAVADTDGDGTFDTAVDDEGNVEVGDFGSIDGGDAV